MSWLKYANLLEYTCASGVTIASAHSTTCFAKFVYLFVVAYYCIKPKANSQQGTVANGYLAGQSPPLCRLLCLLFLLQPLPLVLLGRHGLELQGVDSTLLGHLVLEQRVYGPVAGGLVLGAELLRRHDEPKVSLARRAALHGLVVGVQVGIVVDLEPGRLEGRANLYNEKEEKRKKEVRAGCAFSKV